MQLARSGAGVRARACAAAAALLLPATSAGAQRSADALDSLVSAALAASPLVRAAAARVDAAAARVGPAGARPDPMLMAGVQNLPLSAPGFADEMTMAMVGVGQTVTLPGKRALRRTAAEREVDAARAEVARVRLDVARDVRTAYLDLAYLDRALTLVARNRTLLVEQVRVAESRYGSGADLALAPTTSMASRAAPLAMPTTGAPMAAARAATPRVSASASAPAMGGMGSMGAGGGDGTPMLPAAMPAVNAAPAVMGGAMRAPMPGGALQEILRARAEVARLAEDAAALVEERRAVLARLNAALDRPSATPVDATVVPARIVRAAVAPSAREVRFTSAALGARAAGSPLPSVETLQALATERSPILRTHEALIAAQRARVELARRERRPDLDVALQYGVRPRHPDMITATVSVPIPVQRRRVQDQLVAGARAELTALEAEHHQQLAVHGAEIARLHAEAERARTQLALLSSAAMPQAQASLAASLAAYRAGQAGLAAVLDAHAAVFDQETAYQRALTDFARAVAELERSVGAEVLP
ncbi:TolC family protein [Roseisolibacter agri]|uniref:Outer membrane efflux protein n=1 Tax=Roseisolibacter agri TaxID=2014610 RepID=A0AA37QCI8_9BACT|nr:TolC family protein [Roseisolibacter agri]GLC27782.1 hypothetical protein rosag_42950 [Roseisolibacter agri]